MEVLGLKLHFAQKAWGVENWLDPDNATNTTETSVHGDGSWKCRKGQRVWVRPGMTQCCHDRHTDATWCPWGPDCKLCIEKQERSTDYSPTVDGRGSVWESSSDGWAESPNDPKNDETGATVELDYFSLPRDPFNLFSSDDNPYEIIKENERAKKHPFFKTFMSWLIDKHSLPDDHIWGHPEDEPVLDLCDFIEWLVETGRGFYGDHPEETRMHAVITSLFHTLNHVQYMLING